MGVIRAVVRVGKHAVAVPLIKPLELLRGQHPVRKGGVAVQIGFERGLVGRQKVSSGFHTLISFSRPGGWKSIRPVRFLSCRLSPAGTSSTAAKP
ncbi:hypothetical protein SDC9_118712 [bioreactor metagenome]|uniref:Uncharacterized protein n=1 Tax=bioreactor metagenome TaxID=1076179 RepID=A0A645C455_9ZZZZ